MFVVLCVVLWMHLAGCILAQSLEMQPFCPDMKPPFSSAKRARLCLYRTYGCCTDGEDSVLLHSYIRILGELRRRRLGYACNGLIVDMLCQSCSPLSGYLFSGGLTIPALCREDCESIYNRCARQLQLAVILSSNHTPTIDSFASKESFCRAAIPSADQDDLCFPAADQIALTVEANPAITETSCLCVEKFAENLRNPLIFRHAFDGSQRKFIGEQLGLVYVYLPNGTRLAQPFLDLSSKVQLGRFGGDERGLLGLEFHLLHHRNDKFYVYYYAQDRRRSVTRLSEFRVMFRDRNRADPSSERVLLEIEQPFGNHNGGELLFGDDGYLYVFVGDGGAGGDPFNNAQDKSSLLGKVLRIDINNQTANRAYGIPADNPFVGEPGARPEIFAFGVRNIWRCGKDMGDRDTEAGKGRIVCGDVGQRRFEELDLIQKGANYGWRGREGFECFNSFQCDKQGAEVLPLLAYNRTDGGSVTGGHFYRGCSNPNLNGYYLYGDYVTGKMFKTKEGADGRWENHELPRCHRSQCTNGLQADRENYILSFGQDEDGEVYMLTTGNPSSQHRGGKVYRLVDPIRRGNPDTCGRRAQDAQVAIQRRRDPGPDSNPNSGPNPTPSRSAGRG